MSARVIPGAVGLIPAAGRGMRLGLPYPKELYPVIRDNRYKPVSQFVLDSLVRSGVHDVVMVINETKAQLIEYFGDGQRFGCHLAYVVQERGQAAGASTSPGLADALDAAYHLARDRVVCFGMADTIMEPEDVFARAWQEATPEDDLVLALFPTTRPDKFGMVRHERGRVIEIIDKPVTTTLTEMWGCMLWRPRFTEHLHACVKERGERDFARILNGAIEGGLRARAVSMTDGRFQDLGTYDEILQLDAQLRQASSGTV